MLSKPLQDSQLQCAERRLDSCRPRHTPQNGLRVTASPGEWTRPDALQRPRASHVLLADQVLLPGANTKAAAEKEKGQRVAIFIEIPLGDDDDSVVVAEISNNETGLVRAATPTLEAMTERLGGTLESSLKNVITPAARVVSQGLRELSPD